LPAILLLVGARRAHNRWQHWSLATLFAYCAGVSFVANTFIFEYGVGNWVPALYYLAPLLFYYTLVRLDYAVADITDALIWTGIIAAAVVMFDQVFPQDVLDVYYRRPVFDTSLRRIVILKSETVLALLLLVARLGEAKVVTRRLLLYAAPLAMMAYTVFVVSESRLGIATTVLALGFFAVSGHRSKGRMATLVVAAAVAAAVLFGGAAEKYLGAFSGTSTADYFDEYNVTIRLESFTFFWDQFLHTFGMGFGVMSVSPDADNFQAHAIPLSHNIVDLGWFAALFQFGVLGLFAVMWLTVRLVRSLLSVNRVVSYTRRREVAMIGLFVLAAVLNPVPLNLFTLTHSVLLGSTLWYVSARAREEAAATCSPVRQTAHPPSGRRRVLA
jgi:hypothetical protein